MPKTPQKILFYTDTPLYGGAEKQMLLLAQNFDQKLFVPILVCRKVETLNPLIEAAEKYNLKTYLIKSKSKHSLSNYFQLQKIIKIEKPSLIHIHIWNPMAGKFALLAAKKFKIPVITTEHDPFQLNSIKTIYKNWSLKIPKKIITVSNANQKLMGELYPQIANKLTTIHNGIEPLLMFISLIQRREIRKKLFNVKADLTKVIFSAGTLHQRKGFKYLISAFQKVNLEFPNTKLVIAGEGPERPFLEKLIKNLSVADKVILLGQSNQISELMQSSDIFVLPSIKEAFGLVILEAIAAKLPIIASQVGGIPEILEDKKTGILVQPQNKTKLVTAIKNLLKKPESQDRFIKNSQSLLIKFSAENTAKSTVLLYQEIIKNNEN